MCIRRERVVELVIERCDGLGGNQAEIRPQVVPPAFSGGANSVTQNFCAARLLRAGTREVSGLARTLEKFDGGMEDGTLLKLGFHFNFYYYLFIRVLYFL